MLRIQEYISKFEEYRGIEYLMSFLPKKGSSIIDLCMVEFNEDTADCLCGSYPGNYGLLLLKDFTNDSSLKTLKELEISENNFKSKHPHFQNNELYWYKETPTKEFPYAVKILGNDDSTWTKFYSSLEEAKKEFELYSSLEPLDLYKDFLNNGFYFTN